MQHAKLSPSGSKKWLNCPASIRLEQDIIEEESSYAREGTVAHTLAELVTSKKLKLINSKEYNKKIKEIELEIDAEMIAITADYSNHIEKVYNSYIEAYIELETKVDISRVSSECWGTADAIIINDDVLEIIDFKYGRGVEVTAESNSQMMLYAIGVLDMYSYMYSPNLIKMTIYQPRIGNISTYTISKQELLEQATKFKEKAELTNSIEEVPCAGKWCRTGFCKARTNCKTYSNYIMELDKYKDISEHSLTDNDLDYILTRIDDLVSYAQKIKEYATTEIWNENKELENWKIVEGTSRRKITADDEVIANILAKKLNTDKNEFYVLKLKSLAELEKNYTKKVINDAISDYIEKPEGKPTLVPMSNKKDAIYKNNVSEDFNHII